MSGAACEPAELWLAGSEVRSTALSVSSAGFRVTAFQLFLTFATFLLRKKKPAGQKKDEQFGNHLKLELLTAQDQSTPRPNRLLDLNRRRSTALSRGGEVSRLKESTGVRVLFIYLSCNEGKKGVISTSFKRVAGQI